MPNLPATGTRHRWRLSNSAWLEERSTEPRSAAKATSSTSKAPGVSSVAGPPFEDRVFPSKVFGQERHYRLFLPADYATSGRRYPMPAAP